MDAQSTHENDTMLTGGQEASSFTPSVARSARNSVNRENLTAPAYVGRDSMVVATDKDCKGRLIGHGASDFPILPKKTKLLLIQNEDLLDTNIELADKVNVLEKDLQKVKDTVNVLASTFQGGSYSTSQPPSVPFQAPMYAPNPHLNKKCTLNGFSKAKVAHGEVAFVDPATSIHQGVLGEGFYKILLYEIYSPN
ncbi:hypothetical protein GIB67_042877 [Kingdonia uniflora]|uniref:Uncharacterized protein n=1 Tax=Kingdonia uniflora TaxID=39325 RepID=A0A7J7P6K7_9MAGN|nr:hypothetical protein GIB67_042877 [Kingdonia uniflora]